MSATTVEEISKSDYILYNSCHKLQHTGLQFSVCVYTVYDSQGQFLYYSSLNACLSMVLHVSHSFWLSVLYLLHLMYMELTPLHLKNIVFKILFVLPVGNLKSVYSHIRTGSGKSNYW